MAAAKCIRTHSIADTKMSTKIKRVKFYRDGDHYFAHVVTITPRKYRSFEVLLSELSTKTDLPQGVRYLLDKETGARVNGLEDLRDGREYVCSSCARIKRRDLYGKKSGLPHWGSNKQIVELPPILNPPRLRRLSDSSGRVGEISCNRVETMNRRLVIKPRIVDVYRNGKPKDSARKILLNKRTAQSLNQVLDQVNDALSGSGASNVRKLYTTNGKLICQVSELFADENGIFIAVGSERFKLEDLESINTEDAKNAASHKRSKPHHANEGMPRYKHKEHAGNRHVKSPKHASLPKIHHTNNNHHRTKPENQPNKSPSVSSHKPHSPKHKRAPLGKQTPNVVDNKQSSEKDETSEKTPLKLPPIGEGNVVAKHPANEEQENLDKEVAKKSDSVQEQVSPRGQETGRHKSREEKSHVKKKRSSHSQLSSDSEDEKEYCRITDKRVEDVYDIGRKVGDGNFAVVRQCTDKITRKKYALKIIDKRKIKGKEKMIDDEISIMRHCRHRNIVRLYEDFDTPMEMYLVMKFIEGGDLFDAISTAVKFSEAVAKAYFRDLCRALAYLHKRRIVHRDIKPENLLVHKRANGQSIIKLADFGLAMEVTAPIFTVCGTPTYVAPEILEESGYGLKVDMWAAGVITYIMLCGFPPFRSPNRDQDELFDLIQAGEFEFLSPYWDSVSDSAKDLISTLLVVDAGKRASAEQALHHRWARGRSPTVNELSNKLLEEGSVSVKKKKRFKAAAIAVQGAKRLENLVVDFHREKFIRSQKSLSVSSHERHRLKHEQTPLGKQTQNVVDNKQSSEKDVPSENAPLKLPPIGDGNVVAKHPANEEQENLDKEVAKKSDSVQEQVSPRGQETGRHKSREEKSHVKKKRSSHSQLSSDSEDEKEYCRITDKRVEDVYDIGRKVGDGNFAVVRQCTDKITRKQFALKIIDKRKIKGKEKMIDDEISIMRHCRHRNIVRLYEDFDTPMEMYLVMKFIEGGDLFDAISTAIKFSEAVAKDYFRDLCRALAYLHKRRIVHRDIKPENLLVHKRANGQSIIKLADFGLAMEVTAPIFTVCGTPTYVAPEILEESGYGLKVDMWAAGVITYIMLCGFPPFRSPNRDQDELFDLIQAGEFEFLSPYWDSVSDSAKDLISTLLVVDAGKRASAEQALHHGWARGRSPEEGGASEKKNKRFKAAAIAVQGAKRLENLVVDFHREKFIRSQGN